ncbi:hypothetical protein [Coleofasciculus sp. G2-EDA-02]|uniref:hypothetical protein n=1 Tax=Coleofasciculus sp. G2-EDA-02 TaxID=3069529 RepID=UPI0032FA6C04
MYQKSLPSLKDLLNRQNWNGNDLRRVGIAHSTGYQWFRQSPNARLLSVPLILTGRWLTSCLANTENLVIMA